MVKHNLPVFREANDYIHAAAKHIVAVRGITLQEFDDTFTRKIPVYGLDFPFSSLEKLYEWGSSDHVLHKIEIPALYINALDDLVVQKFPQDAGKSESVILVTTPQGGHLGWHTSATRLSKMRRWTTEPILEWVQLMTSDIVHDACHPPEVVKDADGFLYEARCPEIRCREQVNIA